YPGGTPPRSRNRVTPLVDGEAFFDDLREALARAASYVYVAGWSLTPRMPLTRRGHADLFSTQLVTLLDQAARRVRVKILLWGGRWDQPAHHPRAGPNWHDLQLRIQGEAVADVEENFRQRWTASGGGADLPRRPPRVEPDWQTPVQVVRTIPAGLYPFAPRG